MDALRISSIDDVSFRAAASLEERVITIRFTGTADLTVRPVVERFLADVHEEACRLDAATVNVDMSALEFINSSCLKAFVGWITTVQSMAKGRYHISFLFRPSRDWQRRSIGALSLLGDDVVSARPQKDREP